MLTLTRLQRTFFASALAFALQPTAYAAGQNQMTEMYAAMCAQAADMPKPHGEWDLKGNPKLPEYCACYSNLFGARAMNVAEQRQRNGGKAVGTAEEHTKAELVMRNTCRKQLSLPEVANVK